MRPSNLKRVLIVGGGVPGWIAAAQLNRVLRPLGVTVTLMESVKLGTSGVGEASDPALVRFVREMHIDEAVLMQQCSATFQLGARFTDWFGAGRSSWHPFGLCGGMINNTDLFHFWLKSVRSGRSETYSSYSLQALCAEHGKSPRPARGPSPILERGEYAYHLDTSAFADFMRELATAEGVNHLFDDVRAVIRGEHGVERIETKSGRSLTADLYLDCTPEGLVIETGLGDPWQSWTSMLLCDRAVLQPLPRDPELPPYTRITALSAGAMRQVPLSHRVACIYTYSSGHLQDDAAIRELLARGNAGKASTAEPRYLKLRQGRRQSFWVGNCVALGSSGCEVDPVGASDLLLLQRAVALLVELFPDQTLKEPLRSTYNRRLGAICDTVRDFAALHYHLSNKDTPFWRDSKEAPLPDSVQTLLGLHDEHGGVDAPAPVFLESAYHHVFNAADRMPRRVTVAADCLEFDKVSEIMAKMRAQNDEWLAKLPSHRELMELLHKPRV
jgi:tryptophan 7-halogenase